MGSTEHRGRIGRPRRWEQRNRAPGTQSGLGAASVTLAAAFGGELVAGTPGAVIAGGLALVSLTAAPAVHALVQYLRAAMPPGPGPLPPVPPSAQEGPAPPPLPAARAVEAVEAVTDAREGGTAFWTMLTQSERQALLDRAHGHVYRRGDVLCREGVLAQEVIVILDGLARVWVEEGGVQRTVAFRGGGELVGERAAMVARDRSATVTAEGDLNALRVPARAFAAYLADHPRVQAILVNQVYRRQTERRDEAALPAGAGGPGTALPDGPNGSCTILTTDIQGFSSRRRTDADRRHVVAAMYGMLEEAFAASGLDFAALHTEDRGDGALVVVPSGTPTGQVVDPMLAHLAAALRRYNRRAAEPVRIQLRAAMHVGPVQRDARGVSGLPIITTRRLVDAPAVKRRVAETGADLAFVVSEFVFDNVIAPAPGFVDPARYARVRVRVKETSLPAWLTLEGGASRLEAM
ncbi:cyclic nucleotide-binding domain-containing protein [Actinomadura montaniterrae]|uniref:Cyclic nucleotide-binding domain-containing protein n=1 Tax=Actinomadura montaniterrae TaxID=1803903 RepID=A0A6L3VM72_9ACTN|nr:cyclic nucleotide-binding domain-containing protein [Actinomadura montaniterrae]KAB2368212.1 cyclic nucleotide-binding domain-containing protein [Actinomadura montaniterrae]